MLQKHDVLLPMGESEFGMQPTHVAVPFSGPQKPALHEQALLPATEVEFAGQDSQDPPEPNVSLYIPCGHCSTHIMQHTYIICLVRKIRHDIIAENH